MSDGTVPSTNRMQEATLACRAQYGRVPWGRLIGLLGRPTFHTGSGPIFTPCTGLHTMVMRFPIDLVYVRCNDLNTSEGTVVRTSSSNFLAARSRVPSLLSAIGSCCIRQPHGLGMVR